MSCEALQGHAQEDSRAILGCASRLSEKKKNEVETLMWPKVVQELGQAIGLCVPRVGLESLRGTCGGRVNAKRKRKRNIRRRRLLGALLGPAGSFLEASWGPLGGLLVSNSIGEVSGNARARMN